MSHAERRVGTSSNARSAVVNLEEEEEDDEAYVRRMNKFALRVWVNSFRTGVTSLGFRVLG